MFDDAKNLVLIGFSCLFVLLLLLVGVPAYARWQRIAYAKNETEAKALDGEAELKRAEFSRRVAVVEAQAKMDSAKLLAQVEIERSKGVAEANKIIGDSLAGNESYLRYLWIQGLQTNQMQVVYVPTEANLPILEAGKR